MNTERRTYRELLEREIGLLHALSEALTTGKAAIASCRIQELEESTAIQRHLCAQLEAARTESRVVTPQPSPAGQESASVAELRENWLKARARVQQLNNEVQGVLWRSQRTVNALVNAFRMLEGNYSVEAMKQTSNHRPMQERA
jgi:hypothetical protein